jgi:hypothetical protein
MPLAFSRNSERSHILGLAMATFALLTHLSPTTEGASIFLNEVVALNDNGRVDEDGDRPDWIELFNGTGASVNLGGYGLSDEEDTPFKWVFPSRVMTAGGFALVFASGKDRTNAVNLHANFSIRAEGERLLLTRPDGVRIDDWPAVAIPRDYSYGRQPNGSTSFVFFATPTPGAANTTTGLTAFASAPRFSRAGGFYNTGFDLFLSSTDLGAEIRYTLDGSEPTTNSPAFTAALAVRDRSGESNLLSMISGTSTANQHTDGWFPPNGTVNKATVVRARSFRAGAWPSPIETHTYFVFSNAAQRYALPVISLAINSNDLFNYTTGIYVLGKVFTDYTNAHPGEFLTGHTPANYTQRGDAWERRAHLEYFEGSVNGIVISASGQEAPGEADMTIPLTDPSATFAQNVIVDIQGQSSRSFRQKSLGVKARGDSPPANTIAYELWPGLADRAGRAMTEFPNLRLANSGNDWNETLFRDALCHRICAPTGIDTLAYRPMVVFLDGEYWGIHNAREQLDPLYFERHYGVPRDEVVICETIGTLVDGRPGDQQHFLLMRAFIETNDMTNPANYAWVQTQMDVRNFIAYQASEIYIANADWPHNNIRFWRKRTAQFETNAPSGHDGRWRWALFDTDLSYAHSWSGGYGDNTLAAALNPAGRPGINAPWSTLIFRRLMTNSEFRREFINTYADHLNSTFKENRADTLINEMQSVIAGSMPEHIQRWRTMGNSWITWSNNVRSMRTFASQRPINCRQHLVTQLGLGGFATVTLNVSHTNRGRLRINTLVIDAGTPGVTNALAYPWRGTYFRGVPIELQALPSPGYVFAGWSNRADLGLQDTITVNLSNNVTWTALFERSVPHDLSAGPYRFTAWSADSPAGTYPPHMRFEQTAVSDPGLSVPMESEWQLPYNRTSRSRLNGLGDDGLAFLNTSSTQDDPGAGYLGAAVLAVRTLGVTNVEASWIGGTVTPNQQAYALRLQYAVGDASFQDVLTPGGQPIEYARNPLPGHTQLMGPYTLPAVVNHQPYVSLRWKYYFVAGSSGPRAQLRLDDILVRAAESVSPALFTGTRLPGPQALQFQGVGSPHRAYTLEVSTNLLDWLPWTTVTLDINGTFDFTDAIEVYAPVRFYRLHSP